MPSTTDYLALLTTQYHDKPRARAFLEAFVEPLVKMQAVAAGMPANFDVRDEVNCTGVNLDTVGLWIGRTRFVLVPIPDRFFTWDDAAATGWDVAAWLGADELASEQYRLSDAEFRRALYGKIAANQWKGDKAGAYRTIAEAFGSAAAVQIVDNLDMTMTVLINVGALTEVQRAMLVSQYLPIKPAGVGINFEDYELPPWTYMLFAADTMAADRFLYGWFQDEHVVLEASDWATALAWLPFAGEWYLEIRADGVPIGTITWPAGGIAPVAGVAELLADSIDIPAGTFVTLHGNPAGDATGGDVGVTLIGIRVP